MKTVIGEKRGCLQLDPMINDGREGEIYKIVGHPNELAKIYKHPVTPETAEKLAFMIANPPRSKSLKPGRLEIAWPQERLFDPNNRSRCIGFTMRRVKDMQLLFTLRQKLTKKTFTNQRMAVRICMALARLIAIIHRAGHAIPDLNDRNILVNWKTGGVAAVDCDSFQIHGNGKTYVTDLNSPEYLAPELQGKNLKKVPRTEYSDRFSLAAIFGELLGGGHHPFAAVSLAGGRGMSLPRRIKRGIWPDRRGGVKNWKRRDVAPAFECLPVPVQELFERCFDDGIRDPRLRVSPTEWVKTLKTELPNFHRLTYPPRPYRFGWGTITSGLRKFPAGLGKVFRYCHPLVMARWVIAHPVRSLGILAPLVIAGWVYFRSGAETIPVRMKGNDFTPSKFIEGEPTPKMWEEISRTTSRSH